MEVKQEDKNNINDILQDGFKNPKDIISCIALIFNKKGKILLGKRRDSSKWSFVGGGLDAGETPLECIKREVFEEVGLKIKSKDFKFVEKKALKTVKGNNKIIYIFITYLKKKAIIDFSKDPDLEFKETKFIKPNLIPMVDLHFSKKDNVGLDFLLKNKEKLKKNKTIIDSIMNNEAKDNLIYKVNDKNTKLLKKVELIRKYNNLEI